MKKKHGVAWWLCIGWWWYIYAGLFYYFPIIIIRLCGGGKWLDRMAWSKWKKVQSTEWQEVRAYRAATQDMPIKSRNLLGGAVVYGSSGKTYKVTLRHCSCPDFENRHLPCKHMYRLAMEAGVLDQEDTE